MYNLEKIPETNVIEDFINSRSLKVLLAFVGIFVSVVGAAILGRGLQINPLLLSSVIFTGMIVFLFSLSKCLENKIIPYFLLQFINVWIFINQDFISIKLHIIIFMLSLIVTAYYILSNFKYLWSSPEFKVLILFCALNLIYAFWYSSDFRSSNYIDLWIQNNVGLRFTSIASGYGAASRDFGTEETKFLKYLTGIVPLLSFVIGYMSFYGLKTIEVTKKKLENIIKLFSLGYLSYFFILIFLILIGRTSVMFMENRLAIDKGFTGTDFEGLMLLLFIGFNYYISKFAFSAKWLQYVNNINIAILSALIILGIKKGTILSFLTGFLIFQIGKFFLKTKNEKNKTTPFSPKNINKILTFILLAMIIILPIICMNKSYIDDSIYNITHRFSTTSTLEVRETNWYYYLKYWGDNLSWFTALFGFGTDSSRETSFFLSAMQPDKSFQQPHIHNIYFEYFYNWGVLALLYFLPALIILCKNIFEIVKKNTDKVVKLFSIVSLACIAFFLMYYSTESPAMPAHITFFALIGFLESLKLSFINCSTGRV